MFLASLQFKYGAMPKQYEAVIEGSWRVEPDKPALLFLSYVYETPQTKDSPTTSTLGKILAKGGRSGHQDIQVLLS